MDFKLKGFKRWVRILTGIFFVALVLYIIFVLKRF